MFIACGYAQNDISTENDMKTYCDFKGILKDKTRWVEEFKMLEEPRDHPNFKAMSDMLSIFIMLSKDAVKKCPALEEYLTELVNYHYDDKIKKEVNRAIEYISKRYEIIQRNDKIG